MKKIYIVQSSEGIYEDFHVWNEKAFTKKEEAEKYAKKLDKQHNSRPDFLTEKFKEDFEDIEENLPEWGSCYLSGEEYADWVSKQNAREDAEIIEGMIKRGYTFNKKMYDEYRNWESEQYYEWHPCVVEEIELV